MILCNFRVFCMPRVVVTSIFLSLTITKHYCTNFKVPRGFHSNMVKRESLFRQFESF
jgi:hypothetical protein